VDYIAKLITDSKTYDSFRTDYEGTAHARVHNGIGGDFAQMISPMDPRFFLHHGNVDRHYAIWQKTHPDMTNDYPKDAAKTMLPLFNVPVNTCFDHTGPGYCYTYSNMDIVTTGRSTLGLNKRSLPVASEGFSRLARRLMRRDDATLSNVADSSDRGNMVDLRAVNPAPDWWISMNNLNATRIRELEQEHGIFVDTLNSLPGYVSPCALYNRPTLLERIIEKPHIHEVYIPSLSGAEPTRVNCSEFRPGNTNGAVGMLRQKVQEAYKPVDYDALRNNLKETVGSELAGFLADCGKRFANKPFEYRPEDHPEDHPQAVQPAEEAKQPEHHHHHCHRHKQQHEHPYGVAPSNMRPSSRYQVPQSSAYGQPAPAY